MQRAFYLYVLVPCAVVAMILLLLMGRKAHADEEFPAWTRWENAHRRGDVTEVRCYRKKYLREHIGKKSTRQLFRDNPDARSLCGTMRCRSEYRCHFDALVFVDENPPPVRPAPPVQAKTRSPLKRLFKKGKS